MLNIAIYDTSGTMKRVTKGCYLFCSIDAKPVESREYFYFLLKQNLHMLRVLLAQGKLGCSKWRKSQVWRDSHMILSNQK